MQQFSPTRLPTLSPEREYSVSRSGISQTGANSPKVGSFDFNAHDSYGAYRLNSNTGMTAQLSPKANKIRQGFFGDKYIQDNSPQDLSPVSSPSKWKSYIGSTEDRNIYNSQFSVRLDPIRLEKNNSPASRNLFEITSNKNLPPIQGNPGSLNSLYHSNYVPFKLEPDLSRVEKMLSNQNKHLERLAQSIGLEDSDFENEVLNKDKINSSYSPMLKIKTKIQDRFLLRPQNLVSPNDRVIRKGSEGEGLGGNNHIHSGIIYNKLMSMRQSPTIPIEEEDPPGSKPMLIDDQAHNVDTQKKIKHVAFIEPKQRRRIRGGGGGKPKLKAVLWAMVYPHLLAKDVDDKFSDRKKNLGKVTTKHIQEYKTQVLQFIHKNCGVALKSIYKETKNLVIVNEEKEDDTEISWKDLQKRFTLITMKLIDLLETLKREITKDSLPQPVVDFFASICCDNAILPHRFLTESEISFLEFTHYGTLKYIPNRYWLDFLRNMTPVKSKMIIGMFILVKGLVHVFLNQPWTFLPEVKESPTLVKYEKDFSSLFIQQEI